MLIPNRYALKGYTHTFVHRHTHTHTLTTDLHTNTQTLSCERTHAHTECIDQGHCYLMAKATSAPLSHQERQGKERWKPMNRREDTGHKRKGLMYVLREDQIE